MSHACGDCGDECTVSRSGVRHTHLDGTPLCGSRLAAIKRKSALLARFYVGEANGGMDVPEEVSKALDLTVVVFRKWYRKADGTGVIALFPGIPALDGHYPNMCQSFEHVGQHGTADYQGVISRTRVAKPHEYEALERELESPPYEYKLDIRTRAPKWMKNRG